MFLQIRKPLLVFISMLFLFFCSGCDSDQSEEYEDKIEQLQIRISELEEENQELKDRLEQINSIAVSRDENFRDLLDDIESVSEY